jgi:hypothetical protein
MLRTGDGSVYILPLLLKVLELWLVPLKPYCSTSGTVSLVVQAGGI